MIRKITNSTVLQTVDALQKANVQPRKILEYVREHTDKVVELRDVHNLLASIRKNSPSVATTSSTSAAGAPPPTSATSAAPLRLLPQTFGPSESSEVPQVQQHQSQPRPHQQPQAQFSPSPTLPPTQYGKFLAAFNIGKEIAELMAEMDATRFAHCYAELRMLLRVAESGRVPVVTTREAAEQVGDVLAGIPNTPNPQ
ncbi:unnamed protein product [Phytophthora fragariaefolia]|uniref:Unnamed protein product n=1 Tax=Phytophthora fragariaefolia TaxID=1490495 RepID=A0A9W6Y3D9_9STRA|nr:unnamed protein product [Phytophthora fragariaefolia]